MVTSAENKGRIDMMDDAEKQGIIALKRWISTHDARTRDWHAELDGQMQEKDKPFENSVGKIMYPGDPSADPANIYNCRCAIGYKVTGFGQKQQTKAESGTKEQAVDKLKQIGFNDVESSFVKYVDKDLAVSVTKQLEKLEQRFKAIANSNGNICSVSGGKKTVAYVSSSIREPTRQNLSLCPAYYRDKSVLLESEKRAQKINWMMPCSENEYEIYTVTHEYGHMLENTIIYSEMKQYGLEKLADEINIDAKTAKKMYKPYYDIHNKVTKDCFSEIMDIAKKENPEFSLSENISQYGKTNYSEFFAEVFANSQLSKPNELGKAMQKWLKQKGY